MNLERQYEKETGNEYFVFIYGDEFESYYPEDYIRWLEDKVVLKTLIIEAQAEKTKRLEDTLKDIDKYILEEWNKEEIHPSTLWNVHEEIEEVLDER